MRPKWSLALIVAGFAVTVAVVLAALVFVLRSERKPVILFIDKTPSLSGDQFHLRWSVENASHVEISGIGSVGAKGKIEVYPKDTTEYTLTAKTVGGIQHARVVISVSASTAQTSTIPRDTVETALSKLRPGKITYDPPEKMKVAEPSEIHVRIGKLMGGGDDSVRLLDKALVSGLASSARAPVDIKVSSTMKVLLTAPKEDFQIDLKSPEEQLVDSNSPTEWRWIVVPLRSGKHRLHLSGIALVKIEGEGKQKEFAVYDTDIAVTSNFSRIIEDHWKEAVGAISGTGFFGWLWAKLRRKKEDDNKKDAPE